MLRLGLGLVIGLGEVLRVSVGVSIILCAQVDLFGRPTPFVNTLDLRHFRSAILTAAVEW